MCCRCRHPHRISGPYIGRWPYNMGHRLRQRCVFCVHLPVRVKWWGALKGAGCDASSPRGRASLPPPPLSLACVARCRVHLVAGELCWSAKRGHHNTPQAVLTSVKAKAAGLVDGDNKPSFVALSFGDVHLALQCSSGRVLVVGSTLTTSPGGASAVPGGVSSAAQRDRKGGKSSNAAPASGIAASVGSGESGAPAPEVAQPTVQAVARPADPQLLAGVLGFLSFQEMPDGRCVEEVGAELCASAGYDPAAVWAMLEANYGPDARVFRQNFRETVAVVRRLSGGWPSLLGARFFVIAQPALVFPRIAEAACLFVCVLCRSLPSDGRHAGSTGPSQHPSASHPCGGPCLHHPRTDRGRSISGCPVSGSSGAHSSLGGNCPGRQHCGISKRPSFRRTPTAKLCRRRWRSRPPDGDPSASVSRRQLQRCKTGAYAHAGMMALVWLAAPWSRLGARR